MGYIDPKIRLCWHHWSMICEATDEGHEAENKLLVKISLIRDEQGAVIPLGVYNKRRARSEDRRADDASTKSPLVTKEALESEPDAAAKPPGPVEGGDEAGSAETQPSDTVENLEAAATAQPA